MSQHPEPAEHFPGQKKAEVLITPAFKAVPYFAGMFHAICYDRLRGIFVQ